MTQSTSPFVATSLNNFTLDGTFLKLDNHAMVKPFVAPIDRIEMTIAIFFAQD